MNYPPFPILPGLTFGLTYLGVRSMHPTRFADRLTALGHSADATGYLKAWNIHHRNGGNNPGNKWDALITVLENEQDDALYDPRYSYWLDWFSWYARRRHEGKTCM